VSALRRGRVQGGGNMGKRKSGQIHLRIFIGGSCSCWLTLVARVAALHSLIRAADQKIEKKLDGSVRGKMCGSIGKRGREHQLSMVVGL